MIRMTGFLMAWVVVIGAGSGCAWDPVSDGGYATLRFRVADLREKVTARLAPDSGGHLMDINYPVSLATFDCLAINVTGPGISPSVTTFQNFNNHAGLRAGNTCSYLGVTSGLIAMTGASTETVEMRVPLGPDRLIQVFGVKTSTGLCTDARRFSDNFHAFRTGGATTITEAYEVGRTVKSVFGDTTAPVDSSFVANRPKPFHDCDSYAYEIMNEADLIGYWRFGEKPVSSILTTSDKVFEYSGHLNNIVSLTGTSVYVPGSVSTSGALSVTGIISMTGLTTEFPTNNLSYEVWLKLTTFPTLAYNAIVWSDANEGVFLNLTNTNDVIVGITQTGNTAAVTKTGMGTLADGNWHHIVGTYDGTTVGMVIDNSIVQTNPGTIPLPITMAGAGSLRIEGANTTVAVVDEFSFFRKALNSSDIARHFGVTGALLAIEKLGLQSFPDHPLDFHGRMAEFLPPRMRE